MEAEIGLNTLRWIVLPYVAHLYSLGHMYHCGAVVHDLCWLRNSFEKQVEAVNPSPEKCRSIQSFANNFKEVWDFLSGFMTIPLKVCGLERRKPSSCSWLKGVFQDPEIWGREIRRMGEGVPGTGTLHPEGPDEGLATSEDAFPVDLTFSRSMTLDTTSDP